jgi:hypothetical protein
MNKETLIKKLIELNICLVVNKDGTVEIGEEVTLDLLLKLFNTK